MKTHLPVPARRLLLALAFGAGGAAAFAAKPAPPPAVVGPPVWLSQGWSQSDSDRFYSTTQGSHLLPYAFYVALEQAGSTRLFNSPENIEKYRCIPRAPSAGNPDGLPVGFVADEGSTLPPKFLKDSRSLGFTCAACHTGQITYRGTAMRIDGGPTLADFDEFTIALTSALTTTANNPDKFARFAKRVLGAEAASADKRKTLHEALERTARERRQYLAENQSAVPYGYARLDAFGRIFNTALATVESKTRISPNAPVSFPFLWDTGTCDTVQWTGNTPNPFPGSLARNVGEVVGVFGAIDTTTRRPPHGYASTVRFDKLLKLERLVRHLKSPAWPQKVLGSIDKPKAEAGKVLFAEHCSSCHGKISSWAWLPWVDSFKSKLATIDAPDNLGTDRRAASLIKESTADTGILNGARKLLTVDHRYGPRESIEVITQDTVGRVLIGAVTEKRTPRNIANAVQLEGAGINETADRDKLMPGDVARDNAGTKILDLKYRTRPLNGIWATGPFLHNGSVPTLYDLLLPEGQRPKKFSVGSREFDPVKVGPVTTGGPGTAVLDTGLTGNSNKGHDYGASKLTDEQRWQLVEYMKTL